MYQRLTEGPPAPLELWSGSQTRRPALGEPAAAAAGLRHAGREIPLGLLVEARRPLLAGYPETAVIVAVDGIALTDRHAWKQASGGWEAAAGVHPATEPDGQSPDETARSAERVTFRLADGREFAAPGPGLPYAVVRTLDLAPPELEARISFRIARLVPWEWFRSLSVGSSHGLMIALTTYAHASGTDLAQSRHIAGTGGIRGDGAVTPIGNLSAKASAANRAGVDVLFVPSTQAHELDDLRLPGTTVVPVRSLQEAIEWLAAPVT